LPNVTCGGNFYRVENKPEFLPMNKTKKINKQPHLVVKPATHARIVKITSDEGRMMGRFVDDLINNALDLREHTLRRLG
jgi:hypothetical protein